MDGFNPTMMQMNERERTCYATCPDNDPCSTMKQDENIIYLKCNN